MNVENLVLYLHFPIFSHEYKKIKNKNKRHFKSLIHIRKYSEASEND